MPNDVQPYLKNLEDKILSNQSILVEAFCNVYGRPDKLPDPSWPPMIPDPENPDIEVPNPTAQGFIDNPQSETEFFFSKVASYLEDVANGYIREKHAQSLPEPKTLNLTDANG
jgi:hypothetical protein